MAWKLNENESAANKCCFCCHVRTGTLIIGLISLMCEVMMLTSFIIAIKRPDLLEATMMSDMLGPLTTTVASDSAAVAYSPNPLLYYMNAFDQARIMIMLGMVGFLMILTVCLLYGTIRGNHRFLIPFMSYLIFDACMTGITMIANVASAADLRKWISQNLVVGKQMLLMLNDDQLMLWALIVFVASISFEIYLISVVWSCYNYLKERMEQHQCGRRYVDGDGYNGDTELLLPPKYEDLIMVSEVPAAAVGGDHPPAYTQI